MKILIVSFRFPPYNSVGGLSVGKTAKYLEQLGHEVRVVTARDQQVPRTLPMEMDSGAVVATGWWNPMQVAEPTAGGRSRVESSGFSAGRRFQSLRHGIGQLYRSLMIPDREIGWLRPAYKAGCDVVDDWRPDVIYASAPPYTSLLAARMIAAHTGTPWVAGLRDLWSENPYRRMALAPLDRAIEAAVLKSASGLVVTTSEAEQVMVSKFNMPTLTVMNGYDADELCQRTFDTAGHLSIVYTGVLIHERRDPTALFRAMKLLRGEDIDIVADFYGRDSPVAKKIAKREGVDDLVTSHGFISYHDSLRKQRDADVLLLLQWNHPAERGICPAKIFEYAAALRPVIGIGPHEGVVERLLTQYQMGNVFQRPHEIAEELRRLAAKKILDGQIDDVAVRPPFELSRERQVEKLATFLVEILESSGLRVRQGNVPNVNDTF